jgi:elongation factor 3
VVGRLVEEENVAIVSFVLKDKRILKTEEEIRTVLESVGFTRERQEAGPSRARR